MITKSYVTLASILQIDNQFASMLPKTAHANTAEINNRGGLLLGKDQNTTKNILKRIWAGSVTEVFNLLVNLWYSFLLNF